MAWRGIKLEPSDLKLGVKSRLLKGEWISLPLGILVNSYLPRSIQELAPISTWLPTRTFNNFTPTNISFSLGWCFSFCYIWRELVIIFQATYQNQLLLVWSTNVSWVEERIFYFVLVAFSRFHRLCFPQSQNLHMHRTVSVQESSASGATSRTLKPSKTLETNLGHDCKERNT